MQKKKKVTTSKSTPAKKAAAKPAPKKSVVAEKAPVEKVAKPAKAPKAPKPVDTTPAEPKMTNKQRLELKNLTAEALEQHKKWLKLQKQMGEEKPFDYQMSSDFEIKVPLSHKVHGWGVVIQKRDNYIDVLFEAGMKTLIVNYK